MWHCQRVSTVEIRGSFEEVSRQTVDGVLHGAKVQIHSFLVVTCGLLVCRSPKTAHQKKWLKGRAK